VKRGRPRKRHVAGLDFPGDDPLTIDDVGEDGVTGSTDICGFCGEARSSHFEGRGPCGMNDCKRFREI
jgi:hypothetical protein